MQMQKIQKNTNTSFEKLYMPKTEKIAKHLGDYAANESQKAKPALKELANNYDIYISLGGYKGLLDGYIDIKVNKLTSSKWNFILKKILSAKARVDGYEFYKIKNPNFPLKKISQYDMAKVIIDKTKTAIKQIENKLNNNKT